MTNSDVIKVEFNWNKTVVRFHTFFSNRTSEHRPHQTTHTMSLCKYKYLFVVLVIFCVNNSANTQVGDYDDGYCAPYNGKVCKQFISSSQVWYSKFLDSGWENEKITRKLWKELVAQLSGLCRIAAEVYYTFVVMLSELIYKWWHWPMFLFAFFIYRKCFVLMHFQCVWLETEWQVNCHSVTKTVSLRISNFVTMTGYWLKRRKRKACTTNLEDIFVFRIVRNFHDTTDRQSRRFALMLGWLKWIWMKSHVRLGVL